MIFTDTKIDEAFSIRRTRPENKDELVAMQRVCPPDLPATHTWDYSWEQPTPEELARNRYLLPTLVEGPRELTLSEIASKTKDFESLNHGELRWLFDRNKVKALPLDPKGPKLDEVQGLRLAIRAHVKANPIEAAPNPRAVQVTRPTVGAVALPSDIAAMSKADIETAAGTLGAHEDWKKIANKDIKVQREWLASRRNAQPETVNA